MEIKKELETNGTNKQMIQITNMEKKIRKWNGNDKEEGMEGRNKPVDKDGSRWKEIMKKEPEKE